MTIKRNRQVSGSYRGVLAAMMLAFITVVWQPAPVQAQWTTNGTNINNTNAGNVGVGTTSPAAKLTVQSTDAPAPEVGGIRLQGATDPNKKLILGVEETNNYGWIQSVHTGLVQRALALNPLGGNIGIGTTNPGAKLQVAGTGETLYWGGGTVSYPTMPTTAQGNMIGKSFTSDYRIALQDGNNRVNHYWNAYYDSSAASYKYLVSSEPSVRMRMGIGGTTEGFIDMFAAAAGTAGNNLTWTNINYFSNVSAWISPRGTSSDFHVNSSGNVGIGTTSPSSFLHVNDAVGGTAALMLGDNPHVNAAGQAGYAFDRYSDGSLYTDFKTVAGGKVYFRSGAGAEFGYARTWMSVDPSNGNVGIGTTAPNTKLHVAGDVTVTGNIAAKYQDIAEWVPASRAIPAGTVVVLDPARSNHVLPSIRSYDTGVAGVISSQPGVILGEAGEGKVKVATTGRVKVKVDASRVPIRVGDLLVTSDREGVAMRSEPLNLGGAAIHRPGTLIGKALEPLAEGMGEILVLLSLQ